MKTVIIGGVAAGASAAARLRRLDENMEIVLLEKGEFISYANCGLPYHLGGVIPERENLLVMTNEKFRAWMNVDVRTNSEAIAINRAEKTVLVRNGEREYAERYDKLALAPGAVPTAPKTPGDDDPRVMKLWTIADMDRVLTRLNAGAKRAVIVGAGFVGLEAAENLRERGLDVTIVQRSDHVLPTVDSETAVPLAAELASQGIALQFGRVVSSYHAEGDAFFVDLDNGEKLPADFVVVSVGVRPNSRLAQDAGLECGDRGHIVVNEYLQTSDPDIYAAGDAVEVLDPIFGGKTAIPLAGPANKQGRIVADNIAGRSSRYSGSLGTSVVKVGALTAASVGLTEKRLIALKKSYKKIYIHPSSNASYYPGATRLDLKLIFGDDGTIYGAQIVGRKGVDKRIDTIAQAMRSGKKAPELGELELAYAPPYSSAKDPVNFAGFVAEDVLSGLTDVVYPDAIPEDAVVLDVREPVEHELGAIPGALNIPLGQLRARLSELDKSKLIVCHCQVGLRGYLAERILKQNGFRAANLSGGWLTWKAFHPDPPKVKRVAMIDQTNAPVEKIVSNQTAAPKKTLDVRALPCPGPIVKIKSEMNALQNGESIRLMAAPTFENDLFHWSQTSGNSVVNLERKPDWIEADVVKGSPAPTAERSVGSGEQSAAIIVFSNDFDKAMAALILANGLAASGVNVGMFFTFWGLSILRKDAVVARKRSFMAKMFAKMLPRGANKLSLSKMNMFGPGTQMMKQVMAKQNVLTLPELIQSARDAGVKFIACDMAMGVMGMTKEDLIDVDEIAGVAAFAELARNSNNTLFI